MQTILENNPASAHHRFSINTPLSYKFSQVLPSLKYSHTHLHRFFLDTQLSLNISRSSSLSTPLHKHMFFPWYTTLTTSSSLDTTLSHTLDTSHYISTGSPSMHPFHTHLHRFLPWHILLTQLPLSMHLLYTVTQVPSSIYPLHISLQVSSETHPTYIHLYRFSHTYLNSFLSQYTPLIHTRHTTLFHISPQTPSTLHTSHIFKGTFIIHPSYTHHKRFLLQ